MSLAILFRAHEPVTSTTTTSAGKKIRCYRCYRCFGCDNITTGVGASVVVQDILIGSKLTIRHRIQFGETPNGGGQQDTTERRVTDAEGRYCVGDVVSPLLANVYLNYIFDP